MTNPELAEAAEAVLKVGDGRGFKIGSLVASLVFAGVVLVLVIIGAVLAKASA